MSRFSSRIIFFDGNISIYRGRFLSVMSSKFVRAHKVDSKQYLAGFRLKYLEFDFKLVATYL